MRSIEKENATPLQVGDKFDTPYPFKMRDCSYTTWEGEDVEDIRWIGGCHQKFETADCGYGEQSYYVADGEGRRILEVLAVADMPGKWQRRVIYSCTMIPPEGKPRRGNVPYCVTEGRFLRMTGGYFTDYVVEATA